MESRSRLENIMELKSNIVEYESKAAQPSLAGFLEEMALYMMQTGRMPKMMLS